VIHLCTQTSKLSTTPLQILVMQVCSRISCINGCLLALNGINRFRLRDKIAYDMLLTTCLFKTFLSLKNDII